ncbi:hypothetical protein EXU30_04840 [Shewanella maritima]|uniref:Chalcone isomerase domain-containing protein n=1 Tax=Shewanella maritima TaxID=2520507 RepID=A0A411PEU5_9GAMM|nr:chalcone isomerase family protein [Shewanella maritima]QBF82107.1 hypothetical protein EXU30_04840 [Shewanella maritima]
MTNLLPNKSNLLPTKSNLSTPALAGLLMISSLVSSGLVAKNLAAQPLPNNVSFEEFKLVGEGEMSFMWFDVYRAKLLTEDGRYFSKQQPLILDIEYYRDIEADDLIEATVDQWQHLGMAQSLIDEFAPSLKHAWPDVKQGDRLTFKVNTNGEGAFWYNDEHVHTVSTPYFSQAFVSIWLSENTSEPGLRQALLGDSFDLPLESIDSEASVDSSITYAQELPSDTLNADSATASNTPLNSLSNAQPNSHPQKVSQLNPVGANDE